MRGVVAGAVASWAGPSAVAPAPRPPLAGRVVVLDPGHRLGNATHPAEISRLVEAGGFRKACNTTGTATLGGVPEATVVWRVAQVVRRRLTALGARVVLTRPDDSPAAWGPCVDERGRAGNHAGPGGSPADLTLSLHGDGSALAGAHGWHLVVPPDRAPWTDDVHAPSLRLAHALRAVLDARGLARSTYVGGGTGLVERADLATLNLSDVPVVLAELGNLRDPGDAAVLTAPAGQRRWGLALAAGVRDYLTHPAGVRR